MTNNNWTLIADAILNGTKLTKKGWEKDKYVFFKDGEWRRDNNSVCSEAFIIELANRDIEFIPWEAVKEKKKVKYYRVYNTIEGSDAMYVSIWSRDLQELLVKSITFKTVRIEEREFEV